MDPITTAIVSAVGAGATRLAGTALEDAYAGLKALIRRRYGESSDVYQAVEVVESDPDNEDLQEWLRAEIRKAGAVRDSEILNAAKSVRVEAKNQTIGQQSINTGQSGGINIPGEVTLTAPSQWAGRDIDARTHFQTGASGPGTYIPQSVPGWIIAIPGVASAVVGAIICGIAVTSSKPNSGDFDLGFRFLLIGIIVTIVAEFVDRAVSRS